MDISNILSLPTAVKDAMLSALLAPGGNGSVTVTIPPKPTAKRTSRKAFKKAPQKPAKKAAAKSAKAPRSPLATAYPGLVGDVASTDGSLGAIAKALGVAKPKAAAALKAAVKAGTIHMAGARRFARYGTTPEQAKERAATATGKPAKAKYVVVNGAAVVN